MKPAKFAYRRVRTPEEAVATLAELGEEAKVIAGGQSLVPMMNFRLARPEALVDVSRLDQLRYARLGEDGSLHIGALTRHRDLELLDSQLTYAGFGVIPAAARHIGHYAIRAAGTFGGSLAHADPAAEWCMIAQLLDAEISVLGPAGLRTVPAAKMFKGFLETDLQPDEIILEARLRGFELTAIQEMCRRHGDFAVVAAAVGLAAPDGRCEAARVVLGGVGGTVVRVTEAEQALTGSLLSREVFAEAAAAAARAIDPVADLNGPSEYRRHLASVLVRRALEEAAGSLDGAR